MSILLSPPHTSDLETVICETAEFIAHYQWIWDVKITEFFQCQYWNNIPTEWWSPLLLLTTEQLNHLPFGLTECDWPESLRRYVEYSERLCIDRTVPQWVESLAVQVGVACRRKMTPKKEHEVSRMAGVVSELCRKTNCSQVLDIGSGLGYLGHVLTERCGLKVVGIEKDEEMVETSQMKRCQTTVHLNLSLCQQSHFTSLIKDMKCGGGGKGVCLVGLHCCGDLTPDILRMVSGQMTSDLSAMVIVGCCYHKMSSNTAESGFNVFPISAHLRKSCPKLCEKMNVFGLRLGCQETRARWRNQSKEDHTHHQKNVYYRAVLQAVKPDLKKINISKFTTFKEFAQRTAHELQCPELEMKLNNYNATHHHYASFIEPFTALQVCLQGVIEKLIVTDRLMFLSEQGLSPVPLPLFNEVISPRNVAIVTTIPSTQ